MQKEDARERKTKKRKCALVNTLYLIQIDVDSQIRHFLDDDNNGKNHIDNLIIF